jgi:hypothetical protein
VQQPTATDTTQAAAGDEAATTSRPPALTISPALALPPRSSLPQVSALLRLPGELSNCIYSYALFDPSENALVFSEACALAFTSRRLRSGSWLYFLSRALFDLFRAVRGGSQKVLAGFWKPDFGDHLDRSRYLQPQGEAEYFSQHLTADVT